MLRYYAPSILWVGEEGREGKAGRGKGPRRREIKWKKPTQKKQSPSLSGAFCILQSSIYLRSKNKEIPASAPPRARRNKQSIFAPGDLQRGRAHKSPSMHLSKGSAAESCVIWRCCRGPPSSSNRCAGGHPQPRCHLPLPERKDGNHFPIVSSFLLLFFSFLPPPPSQCDLCTSTLGLFWLGLQTTGLPTVFSRGSGLHFVAASLSSFLRRVVFLVFTLLCFFRIYHKIVVSAGVHWLKLNKEIRIILLPELHNPCLFN